jgi:hypothetical protein
VTEGRVVDDDVFRRDALGQQIGFEDLVRGARIDVVGAGEVETLDAVFQQVIDSGIACWFGAAPV